MPSINELDAAITRLAQSERGRDALTGILDWFDNGGLGLDQGNMAACSTILWAAWTDFSGTTRHSIRAVLANPNDPGESTLQSIHHREEEGIRS